MCSGMSYFLWECRIGPGPPAIICADQLLLKYQLLSTIIKIKITGKPAMRGGNSADSFRPIFLYLQYLTVHNLLPLWLLFWYPGRGVPLCRQGTKTVPLRKPNYGQPNSAPWFGVLYRHPFFRVLDNTRNLYSSFSNFGILHPSAVKDFHYIRIGRSFY